jgi:hypothetical protein
MQLDRFIKGRVVSGSPVIHAPKQPFEKSGPGLPILAEVGITGLKQGIKKYLPNAQ